MPGEELYAIDNIAEAIQQNMLPLEIREFYSREAEFVAQPWLSYDDSRWVEQKGEFKAQKTQLVYWLTYRGILPAIQPLSETADKKKAGLTEFTNSSRLPSWREPAKLLTAQIEVPVTTNLPCLVPE